jgi:hypothetical protein
MSEYTFLPKDEILSIIREAKKKYENKTGIEGASTQFRIMNLIFDLYGLFDFSFSLELRILIDLQLNFNFDFDITFPDFLRAEKIRKARYGYAIYGEDYYDPEENPPVSIGRGGTDIWAENVAWKLSYKYTSHYGYTFHNPLWHSQKVQKSYNEYFKHSPYIYAEELTDIVVRLAETFYMVSCWFDFNGFDLAQFYPEKIPIRFPKEYGVSNEPYFDLDLWDIATFDTYERDEFINWVDIDKMSSTLWDLALFDISKFNVRFIPQSDNIQKELEDYKLRSNPAFNEYMWLKEMNDMAYKLSPHISRMMYNNELIKNFLSNKLTNPGQMAFYMAFAKELVYKAITLKVATNEQIILKYKELGLDESLLRSISKIVIGV